jgi:hypothetical protein
MRVLQGTFGVCTLLGGDRLAMGVRRTTVDGLARYLGTADETDVNRRPLAVFDMAGLFNPTQLAALLRLLLVTGIPWNVPFKVLQPRMLGSERTLFPVEEADRRDALASAAAPPPAAAAAAGAAGLPNPVSDVELVYDKQAEAGLAAHRKRADLIVPVLRPSVHLRRQVRTGTYELTAETDDFLRVCALAHDACPAGTTTPTRHWRPCAPINMFVRCFVVCVCVCVCVCVWRGSLSCSLAAARADEGECWHDRH